MTSDSRGFSIVEVLVAIVILTIGVLALAQSSGTVSSMIGRGKQDTRASAAAQQVLERLRQDALAAPGCADVNPGSRPIGQMTLSWTVATNTPPTRSDIVLTVQYPINRGTRSDTIRTVLRCR